MRTSEELMSEYLPFFTNLMGGEKGAIKKLINEARKQALEEAAEKFDNYEHPTIQTKDDILNLINDIK